MKLFRLARRKHAKALDGLGAKLYPGRWNSLDVPMIYCADSIQQCMLEVLVHLEEGPDDYCSVELIVPDDVGMVRPDPKSSPNRGRKKTTTQPRVLWAMRS